MSIQTPASQTSEVMFCKTTTTRNIFRIVSQRRTSLVISDILERNRFSVQASQSSQRSSTSFNVKVIDLAPKAPSESGHCRTKLLKSIIDRHLLHYFDLLIFSSLPQRSQPYDVPSDPRQQFYVHRNIRG